MKKLMKALLPYGFVRFVQKRREAAAGADAPAVDPSSEVAADRGRPTVLLVDEIIPAADRDAGGRQITIYVRLLTELGYRVYLGSDTCLPRPQYEASFRKLGVTVLGADAFSPERRVDWFRRNGRKLDFVFLHRPHVAVKFWHLARIYTDAKLIFFGADLAQVRLQREYELTKAPERLAEVELARREEDFLYTHSDANLCVGTAETAFVAKRYPAVPVREIPLFVYDRFIEASPGFDERSGLLFVGGFNHRPNRDAVAWFVGEILPLVRARCPDAVLHVVGSNAPDEIRQLASPSVVVHGFISDEELTALYGRCRVTVAPLRYGAGVKGKIVDALYNRSAVVTTSVGAEGIPQEPMPFAVADTAEDFAARVAEAYSDPAVWNRLRTDAATVIRQAYSRDRAVALIKEVFDGR